MKSLPRTEEMQPYFAYLPQVKWFQFSMQRSTRCVSSIADWTSVPPHKQRQLPTTCLLLSCRLHRVYSSGCRGWEGWEEATWYGNKTLTIKLSWSHTDDDDGEGQRRALDERGKKIRRTNAQIVQTGLFVCLFSHILGEAKINGRGTEKKTIWRLLTLPTIFPLSEAQRENDRQACRFQDR